MQSRTAPVLGQLRLSVCDESISRRGTRVLVATGPRSLVEGQWHHGVHCRTRILCLPEFPACLTRALGKMCLGWETSCTSQLARLPKLRDSDSESDSSDGEDCVAVPISRFAQGDRRACPKVTVEYYPSGEIPETWRPNAKPLKPVAGTGHYAAASFCTRHISQQTVFKIKFSFSGYEALLGRHIANEDAVDRWHRAAGLSFAERPPVVANANAKAEAWPSSMSHFYWGSVSQHLYEKLLQVRQGLERKWEARDPSTRWRFVESTVKISMLQKISTAKYLYRCDLESSLGPALPTFPNLRHFSAGSHQWDRLISPSSTLTADYSCTLCFWI